MTLGHARNRVCRSISPSRRCPALSMPDDEYLVPADTTETRLTMALSCARATIAVQLAEVLDARIKIIWQHPAAWGAARPEPSPGGTGCHTSRAVSSVRARFLNLCDPVRLSR
jgi:hypothetical protein